MRFYCSVCKEPIDAGRIIFVCRGNAGEPVQDEHKRLRAMHDECAEKIGMVTKYPVYILDDGTLYE